MKHIAPPTTGRPVTLARHGMVATPHYLATQAGVGALARGGSAIDAIIAASAMLSVAYPHMVGLGGDCFWLIWHAKEKQLKAINGSGRAAEAATIDCYRKRGFTAIPYRGPMAANTVPGAVDGWSVAHQRYGKLTWPSLFEAAIDYAQHGVPVSTSLALWLANDRDILAQDDLAARIFLDRGRPREVGEVLVQSDLAESFKEVAAGGRDAFYRGNIARQIVHRLQAQGGLLSLDDFAAHHSDWVEPICTSYRGHDVHTFPPNSQGLTMLSILNLIEGYDIEGMGDGTADYLHHVVEATKVAFADRDRWVSDPEFVDIPIAKLLAKDYAAERRQLIQPGRVATELSSQQAANRDGKGDTVYLCAVDGEGNCASFIQSIFHDFGSAFVGGETGIILQNRGSFFSLDPTHTNRLEPRKRTLHTLMPSMILRQGKPYAVFGTMGGEGQPQTQTAMVTRLIDFGYDVQQAIEAPRWLWGRSWGEQVRTLRLEARFPTQVAEELRQRGHQIDVFGEWSDRMGMAQQIRINPQTGILEGAADPRGDGAAMGL